MSGFGGENDAGGATPMTPLPSAVCPPGATASSSAPQVPAPSRLVAPGRPLRAAVIRAQNTAQGAAKVATSPLVSSDRKQAADQHGFEIVVIHVYLAPSTAAGAFSVEAYSSAVGVTCSDHRPVFAHLSVDLLGCWEASPGQETVVGQLQPKAATAVPVSSACVLM